MRSPHINRLLTLLPHLRLEETRKSGLVQGFPLTYYLVERDALLVRCCSSLILLLFLFFFLQK